MYDSGFGVSGLGFGVWGFGFRVSGSWLMVQDFRDFERVSVSGFRFRVSGLFLFIYSFGFYFVLGCGV